MFYQARQGQKQYQHQYQPSIIIIIQSIITDVKFKSQDLQSSGIFGQNTTGTVTIIFNNGDTPQSKIDFFGMPHMVCQVARILHAKGSYGFIILQ